eukprot:s2759_g16.t1
MASFRSGNFRLLLITLIGSACFSGWQWSYKQQPAAPKVRSCHCIVSTRAATSDTASEGEGSKRLQRLFERALEFSDRGYNDRAIRTYKEIIRNFPQCQEAWLNLGICRASIDPDHALRAFDKALALDPSYHDAHYNKALVLDDLGLVSEALESFRLAEEYATLQKDLSSSAVYCCSSGLLLASEQRYDQALSAYDRAIRLDPEGPSATGIDARINRGELLCELQRFSEAIQSHNEALAALAALEMDSKDSLRCGILYNLAYTYAVQGDKASCEETLNRALTVDRAQVLTILLNFQGEASLLSQRRQEEMAFLTQLEDGSKDRGLLVAVVKHLRSLEENPRWILERLLDSAQSDSAATAYGTTWLESWWRLADQAKLYANDAASMVVLGSSLGWQCFLGHLHLGYASCVGYEILKSQVAESQQLAEDFGLQNAISFRCQDALTAEVRGAKLVWLNTYAWPAEVKQFLCEKLLKELSAGTLVVSYEAIPDDFTAGDISLELQSVEEMETSWDPQLLAHVSGTRDLYASEGGGSSTGTELIEEASKHMTSGTYEGHFEEEGGKRKVSYELFFSAKGEISGKGLSGNEVIEVSGTYRWDALAYKPSTLAAEASSKHWFSHGK